MGQQEPCKCAKTVNTKQCKLRSDISPCSEESAVSQLAVSTGSRGLRVHDRRLRPNQTLVRYTLARSAKLSRLSSKSLKLPPQAGSILKCAFTCVRVGTAELIVVSDNTQITTTKWRMLCIFKSSLGYRLQRTSLSVTVNKLFVSTFLIRI